MQITVTQVCPTKTQAWIKRGALLIDVREKNETERIAFNVPNIIHIPFSEFEDRFSVLPLNKEMVLACHDSSRSLRATAFLIHKGYDAEKVVNMKHGLIRWVQRGFSVTGDVGDIDISFNGCCNSDNHTHRHHHDSCCK